MTHVQIGAAVGSSAYADAGHGGFGDVLAWVGSSDSASAGIALAGSLIACLVIASLVSYLRRSRL